MKVLIAIVAALWLTAVGPLCRAEPRLALVVGVSRYGAASLPNAVSDAKLVASALQAAGFDRAIPLENPSKLEIERAVDDLAARAEKAGKDSTIVVYFAGHGMKVLDHDYLIPPDSTLLEGTPNARDFRREALDAESLLATLGEVSTGRIILILDACRTRPAPKDERAAPSARDAGLAEVMSVPNGPDTLILFAAEPGQPAFDGAGRSNGFFAEALAAAMRKPGLQISELVTEVRERVWTDSRHRQRPFQQGGGFRFAFIEGPPAAPKPAASSTDGDEATWRVALRRDNEQTYAMYLELYGAGLHTAEAQVALSRFTKVKTPIVTAATNKASALAALSAITREEWETAPRQAIATKVVAATKLPDLEAVANDKDSRAQFVLATLYEYGAGGVAQNGATATALFREAAQANNAAAQFVLGDDYYFGINGVSRDAAAARDLFLKAAGAGHVAAASRLADIYLGYAGLPTDDALARKYVVQAASRGDPWAQCRLGMLYEDGKAGFPKSPLKSREWAERSANQDSYCGQVNLAGMYWEGSHGLRKDGAKSFELYTKAARSGEPIPLMNLAAAYEGGRGVEKNLPESVRQYEKAALKGYAPAQQRLGYFYAAGIGTEKNQKASVRWFEAAAAQGDALSQHELGVDLLYGMGVEKDEARAAQLFIAAAAQGEPMSQAAAGAVYENGYGVAKDEQKAVAYYKLAAKRGNSDGQLRLAHMYLEGRGGLRLDPKEGRRLMNLSAGQGYQPAKDWLASHPNS